MLAPSTLLEGPPPQTLVDWRNARSCSLCGTPDASELWGDYKQRTDCGNHSILARVSLSVWKGAGFKVKNHAMVCGVCRKQQQHLIDWQDMLWTLSF